MDLLKINEQSGLFSKNGEWVPIGDIDRDDLLVLIQAVANHEEIELDECNEDNPIKDPIAKTIYEQVYKVLNDLNVNREIYLASIDEDFDELERQYDLN